MDRRLSKFGRVLAAATWSIAVAGQGVAELKGYEAASLALLVDVDRATGAVSVPPELSGCPDAQAPSNTVYGVGFTSGFAFAGDELFGLEFDPGGSSDVYLYQMDTGFCAQGARAREQPIGVNLEALASGPDDSTLYTVDFDTGAHQGEFVTVDLQDVSASGAGRHMARDVWIVGLAYDHASGELFGVSNGYADRNVQELYRIDPSTGIETLIGPTGTNPQELQSLAIDPSTSPPRLLAAGATLYELDRGTGAATPIGGTFATIFALAERQRAVAEPPSPTVVETPTVTSTPAATHTPRDTPTQGPCFGDCNGDDRVAVNELITGVNIALGALLVDQCPEMDGNRDGVVSVSELIRAVNAALNGCTG